MMLGLAGRCSLSGEGRRPQDGGAAATRRPNPVAAALQSGGRPLYSAPTAGPAEIFGFRPRFAPTGEGRPFMWITSPYAQAAPGGGGGLDQSTIFQFLPFVAIIAIMYVLMIRPQQKRMKQHQLMVKNLRKGDSVVTSGGTVGKV